MNRRLFLLAGGSAAVIGLGMLPGLRIPARAASDPLATATTYGHDLLPNPVGRVEKTAEDWKALLSPEEFAVLREEATERPFTSPLLEIKETGTYTCAGCELPLYRSETKFDSRTGWPSFYEGIAGALGTKRDFALFLPRTEVHCIRCEGHQGHIFTDGPAPTGNRHCINGAAMKFVPDTEQTG